MTRIHHVRQLLHDEHAATTVEYAVMLALVLLAVFSAITAVGNSTAGLWSTDTNRITNAMNGK